MRWYEGNIAEAVTLSKENGAIFVVFVQGDDDKSKCLEVLIDKQEVSQLLESDNFVAIKIKGNSVSYQQFSDIYKQVPIPSLYFIGKSGTPLEIIEKSADVGELEAKINAIMQKKGCSSLQTQNKAATKSFLESETVNEEVTCKNGVCTIQSKPSTSQDSENSSKSIEVTENELENKVQRAKELIEKQREAKKLEEDEKERNREIERRKAGQSAQNFKKWQLDQELKELMEQRNKEKKEQQAARQRILAQIEQDKADRAARFSNPSKPKTAEQQSPQPVRRVPANTNTARLQFKLPDGSSRTQDFNSEDTLQDVRNYIRNNLNLPYNNFILSTTFPRREFGSLDDDHTLLDLELVPNAVVLILPISSSSVSTNSQNFFSNLLWTFITPFLNIFSYVKSFLFGTPPPSNIASTSARNNKRVSENTGESSRIPKRRSTDSSTVVRRQGNIHRLSDKTESDDDNNTWNGNSTQQM